MAMSEAASPRIGDEESMDEKPEVMLVCQSRQVPMKSKRRALGRGWGVGFEGGGWGVDMFLE